MSLCVVYIRPIYKENRSILHAVKGIYLIMNLFLCDNLPIFWQYQVVILFMNFSFMNVRCPLFLLAFEQD